MKEYGGYFELEKLPGNEYYPNSFLRFNYCRTAWQYLLKARKILKVYLPYYICDSLIKATVRSNVQIEFCHIDKSFFPIIKHTPKDKEILLFVNYFGFFTKEQLQNIVKKYKNVVIDNTHAFFSHPIEKIDTLYSCRKFFGVPDGGYLFAEGIERPFLPKDNSVSKMNFLVGRLEDGAEKHYLEYRYAEENAETTEIKEMSNTTKNILRGIDYEQIKRIRKQNYLYLDQQLRPYNELSYMPIPEVPYVYPFYFEGNASQLRTFLIKNHVYVSVLWESVHDFLKEDCLELRLTDHILPLPIDQRYTIEDMDEIISIVKRGLKTNG